MVRLAEAPLGPLQLNATFLVEMVAFLIMLGIMARWVYPPIMRAAEARQKQIADQLAAAERARQEAEARSKEEERILQEARERAQQIIDAASRSGERLRQEAQEKAQEEARRIVEQAKKEIDAERQRAIQAIRQQMGDLVISATQRVLGETLDGDRQRRLVEQAIAQVEKEPSAAQ
ncbi:MAG TPA: F0F1 ATP synthase subunit B [Candidatus Limnocylindrales bacterium]|nr:F0F1 ATP synthase subunit B [Candidatus Limnocylindrales bacterium]